MTDDQCDTDPPRCSFASPASGWQPAGFKIAFARDDVLKCCHRDRALRCEDWAVWRVPPRLTLTGNNGTRYYCDAHVPDLPERPTPSA